MLLGLVVGCAGNRFATESEVVAEAHARFDQDRNGIIDAAEYARFSPRADGMDTLDLNGDGGIDATEFGTFLDTVSPRPIWGGRTRPVSPSQRRAMERQVGGDRGGEP